MINHSVTNETQDTTTDTINISKIPNKEELKKSAGSATSTWSGFVYQGKVGLYHSLKLLEQDNSLKYSLQLDSLEDFSIINNDFAISIHQVKAKLSKYRTSYLDAFKKVSDKSLLNIVNQDTERFLHVTADIDDDDDYEDGKNKVCVYEYGDNKYCKLSEIDGKIKETICKVSG
ncbi:hypothetical protein C9J12_18045 [Photobacterium frigidiphilum]|uniref:Uncharacterized protein n=1 Tax=Photobacterium frigidiphilum TaxID=264736 RepID=A0A2T3JCN7_9GAMM|nr:hypothetical protein [Photobacterium frigidiphilum]PSU46612.1 hypothetical protein C9J12_18045 [Photobacterium frigidiphilum]